MEIGQPRTLSYWQCIHLIQEHLNNMPHGRIKPWCEEHNLTYNTVLGIKSNRISFYAPNLVADVLRALDYEVWQTKSVTKNKENSKDKEAKKKENFYIIKKLDSPNSESIMN